MPAMLDRMISKFRGRKAEVPIINDGARNLPTIRVVGGFGLPPADWTDRSDYGASVAAGYCRNVDVYSCVSLIAAAGKQVKWWDGGGNTKNYTPREQLAKAIAQDPDNNPDNVREDAKAIQRQVKAATDPRRSIDLLKKSGGAEFIEAWLSYLLLTGNDFIEIDRAADRVEGATRDRPTMLYLLRPDRVVAKERTKTAHRYEKELVAYWNVTMQGSGPRPVDPDNMTHGKLFNPFSDIYGMAPLQAALLRVDTQNEGLALMKRMLERGYSPGWIEARQDSMWDDTQVAQLKERMRASKRSGEELFLENASWHQMGFNPADSTVTDQSILTKRDIAAVFHVPPQLIGDTTSQTYSNYQEARRALYMEAVIPLLVQFKDDWNRVIGRDLVSPLDFDRDSFDAIQAARAEACDRVTKLFSVGLITQNEARADLEYDPLPDGDVCYAPANIMPLGEAAPAPPKP